MDKKLSISLIQDKIQEHKDLIKKMRAETGIRAEGTINTQTHLKRREIKLLTLVKELVMQCKDGIKLSPDSLEFFESFTCPASLRQMGSIKVHEGDSLMKLLSENQDTRDAMGKIQRACEKAGLTIDYTTGTIVKA